MQDWEVRKVNQLYTQLDVLQVENRMLKNSVEIAGFEERLDAVEKALERLIDVIDRSTDVKPTRSSKKTTGK